MNRGHSMQEEIELPHMPNGEVDWNTLGNMLSAHILGEVLCASYVDFKYGRMMKGLKPDTDWEFAYEENDVIVLRKQVKDHPIHSFMGRGVIEVPMDEVVSYIGNLQTRYDWDKYCFEIREERRFSDTDVLVYLHLKANGCLVRAQRDLLYFERMMHMADGKYVQTAMSVEHPDHPPVPGIIRGQLCAGSGWVIEPYEGSPSKTLVTYCAQLDLVGLPAIIINRSMRRQPMSIRYIREYLTPSSPLMERRWSYVSTASMTQSDGLVSYNDNHHTTSSHHYEEPNPITAFTGGHVMSRQLSTPVKIDSPFTNKDASSHQPGKSRIASQKLSGHKTASHTQDTPGSPPGTECEKSASNHSLTSKGSTQDFPDKRSADSDASTTHRGSLTSEGKNNGDTISKDDGGLLVTAKTLTHIPIADSPPLAVSATTREHESNSCVGGQNGSESSLDSFHTAVVGDLDTPTPIKEKDSPEAHQLSQAGDKYYGVHSLSSS